MAAGDRPTIVAEMVFPGVLNHHGTLFAGEALTLMTKAAFIAASREAKAPVVMASVERTEFRAPVPAGTLAEVSGHVTARGTSSLTVETELVSENFITGERRVCCLASFTMVTVGADGRPTPLNATTGS
jgi:acyl-CoA hydrolase